MTIGIVTDSTADIPSELAEQYNIQIVPAILVIDGQSTTTISVKDNVVISKAEKPARFVKVNKDGFYAKVKSKLA